MSAVALLGPALVLVTCAGSTRAANVVPAQVLVTPVAGGTLNPGVGSVYSAHQLVVPPGGVATTTTFRVAQEPALNPERWPQRASYTVSPGYSPPVPWPFLAPSTLRAAFQASDVPPGFTAAEMRMYRGVLPETVIVPPPPQAWIELNEPAGAPAHVVGANFVSTTVSALWPQIAALPTIVRFVSPTTGCVAGPNVTVSVDLKDWNVFLAAPQGGFDGYAVTINGVSATRLDPVAQPQRFSATLSLTDGSHELVAVVTDLANDRCFEKMTVLVDSTGPGVVAGPAPSGCTQAAMGPLTATFSDGSGCGIACSTAMMTLVPGHPSPQPAACAAGALSWSPPLPLAEGAYSATASVADAVGNIGTTAWTFTVDLTAPELAAMEPPPLGCTSTSPQLRLAASFTDACGVDASAVRVLFGPESGTLDDISASCDIDDTGFECDVPSPATDGTYTVMVADLLDDAGNSADRGWVIRYDATAPTVSDREPPPCTRDSPLTISASFSDDCGLDLSELQVLYGPDAGPLDDITTSCAIDVASLSCAQPDPTAVGIYRVRLVHLRDGIGNERDATSPEEWTFTWDDEPPIVTSMSPTSCTDGSVPVTISATWSDGFGCGVVIDDINPMIVVDSVPIPHADLALTMDATGFTYVKAYSGDHEAEVEILGLGDAAGNVMPVHSWTFDVDRAGPAVANELPVESSVVTSASRIHGTWAEGCAGVDLATVTVTVSGNPCLMDPGEPTATGFWCTPTLSPDPVQHVVVSATDLMGHPGGRSWDFVIGNCLHLGHAESPAGTTATAAKIGSTVSLIGDCITNGATVDFAGRQILSTTFVSSTRLDFVVPPGARGGAVRIVNPDGQASNAITLNVVIADGLSDISGLVLGTDDFIYVANQGSGQILRISPEDGTVTVVGGQSLAKGLTREPANILYYGSNEDPDTAQVTANRIKQISEGGDTEWTTSTSFFTRTRAGGLAIDPVTFATFPKVFEASTANTGASDGGVVYRTQGTDTPAVIYSTPLWPGASAAHVGMAFALDGNDGGMTSADVGSLYVTSGSRVFKIPPHVGAPVANVTTATGIFGAAGLDLSAELGRLLVTSTTGRLWLVDPQGPTSSNKVQVVQGLNQSRYARFDTLHRSWDGPLGGASPSTSVTQVIVAEPTRVLSVRFGVDLSIDSVRGWPSLGPPVVDEFLPAVGEMLVVDISGRQALDGDALHVELVRIHDDPRGGAANASRLVHDLGTFGIGPSGDIVPDAGGAWTHQVDWDGSCGGSSCDDCAGGCPVVTRTTPAGRRVTIQLPSLQSPLRPGQYVVRARLVRNGFVLGEAQHDVFIPLAVQVAARWSSMLGSVETFGNLHTNMRWMGLATSPGDVPATPEELSIRQSFLEQVTDFVRTTVGIDTARIRFLAPADDPSQVALPSTVDVLVGGDHVVSNPADPQLLCGQAAVLPPPGSCENDASHFIFPYVQVWTGRQVDSSGVPLQDPVTCKGCSGVPTAFAQDIADCQPYPPVWGSIPRDIYYEVSRRFVPEYGGTPVAPGEWPIVGTPTDRQQNLSSYITAFARHTGMIVAHEIGHVLGVPQFHRWPDCSVGGGHNIDIEPTAPPGTPHATRDTAHDIMDAGWLYTPDAGIVGYSHPLPLEVDDTQRARFQDIQCDAVDPGCTVPSAVLHPFSHDDIQSANR